MKNVVARESLYDYLFENDFDGWFCNLAKTVFELRDLKELILRLHTGETLADASPDWTWEQRQRRGQRYLFDLAEAVLRGRGAPTLISALQRSLELDGYVYRDGRLLTPESDVLDVKEEEEALHSLYKSLALPNEKLAFHDLALSEEHYLAQRWDDSISNSRQFLECVLQEVASAHHSSSAGQPLPEEARRWPIRVRAYLERAGLLESKEAKTLAEVYGLLSETGSHPYMARNDQARLLRHLALTFSQFVMLRLEGFQKQAK